jgi:hypothetical protein
MTHAMVQGVAAAVIVAVLVIAFAIGKRLGRRHPDEHSQLGVIQAATLGLMGLLLGFSYSGAIERFEARQRLIVQEANAMGTVWLRCDLLSPDASARVRQELREYGRGVLDAFRDPGSPAFEEAMLRAQASEQRMWDAVQKEVNAERLQARETMHVVNQLFDVRAERVAAARRHMPMFVLGALVACAAISVGAIGYGLAGGRAALVPPAIALIVLMTIVLWIVLDMDYPRYGFIRVDDRPLIEALKMMQ